MTTVYFHPTIAAALMKAEQKLETSEWTGCNPEQEALVAGLPDLRRLVADMPPGLQGAIGSDDAEVINAWLAERGYNIKLDAFEPGDFGVAAALDVLAKWRSPGSATTIRYKETDYPAVAMKDNFTVFESGGRSVIQPHSDVRVLLAAAADLDDGLKLVRSNLKLTTASAVAFPMVDHAAQVDMAWLVGLRTVAEAGSTNAARLTQVVAEAKLRINELGAHAKAAVAAGVTRGGSFGRQIMIAEPFVIAFMHRDQVMVAFHVTPESWKKPPNLGEAAPSVDGKRTPSIW